MIGLIALVACSGVSETPPTRPSPAEPRLAAPDPSWIEARVTATEARLAASDAGRVVDEAIEAAGGLRAWYAASPLEFRFAYQPLDGKTPRDTRQVVDLWRSRAVHTWMEDPEVTFGWDGETAWQHGNDGEIPINPRFWSLTPYYFVGIPFVLGDEGVELRLDGTATFEDRDCQLVRVGFADGTGDAPDDAYVVYVDQATKRVVALRYVVSYPGFFPDGGHGPWKLMAYDGTQQVAGLKLPERFRTWTWNDAAGRGELVTKTTLSELAVRSGATLDGFAMPEGATPQIGL